MVAVAARSVPNQGFSRARLTALRVVATSTAGLVEISEASKRAPPALKLEQPASVTGTIAEVSAQRTVRREGAMPRAVLQSVRTTYPYAPPPPHQQPSLMPDRGDSGAAEFTIAW